MTVSEECLVAELKPHRAAGWGRCHLGTGPNGVRLDRRVLSLTIASGADVTVVPQMRGHAWVALTVDR